MALIDSLYAHMCRGGMGGGGGGVMSGMSGGAAGAHPLDGYVERALSVQPGAHQQQMQQQPALPMIPRPMGVPQLPRPMQSLSSFEPFCSVPGRLTLLSNVKKVGPTNPEDTIYSLTCDISVPSHPGRGQETHQPAGVPQRQHTGRDSEEVSPLFTPPTH